jgi:thioesterase domain-containing protein
MTVDGAGSNQRVQTLQAIEPRPPVVFVLPGLGGEDDPELERFWGPTRTALDLAPVTYLDWTDLIAANDDFTIIADHVRRQIESRIPEGPIRMTGYSIGGHLAYITALAFEKDGRPIESIMILDAPVEVGKHHTPLRQRLLARLRKLFGFKPRAALASLLAKLLMMERFRPLLHRLARYRQTPLPFRFHDFLHHTITMQLVLRIYPAWWRNVLSHAAPLDSPVSLFRSEEHQPGEAEDLGWSKYCRNLTVVNTAGSHRGMLHPSVNGPLREAFISLMVQTRRKPSGSETSNNLPTPLATRDYHAVKG